jgi:hypothetical protein
MPNKLRLHASRALFARLYALVGHANDATESRPLHGVTTSCKQLFRKSPRAWLAAYWR